MIGIIKKRLQKGASNKVAKERLQVILVHDRIKLSPVQLQQMKKDIISVVSQYIEIDATELEISLQRTDQNMALHANIPIRNARK